jgi:hypothetical protein
VDLTKATRTRLGFVTDVVTDYIMLIVSHRFGCLSSGERAEEASSDRT